MAASRIARLRGWGKHFYCTAKTEVEAEVVKETRRQQFANYLKRIADDYKDVFIDAAKDIKAKPLKAAAYFAAIGVVGVLAKTNPDEQSFRAHLIENTNELLQVGDTIRNPTSDNHMQMLMRAYNEGIIRKRNLFVCTVMWCADYDRAVDIYQARCSQCKPQWRNYPERIVDIGVLGKWRSLTEKMTDYDINPSEWPEENSQKR